MFGQVDIEGEAAKHLRRGDAGNQNGREQRGDDNIKQVVAGVDGRDSDDDADQDIDQAGVGDVVIHGLAETAGDDTPRQVGDSGEPDEGGKQQSR